MNGAALTLLLLLSGRAAFTAARSLNAPQDPEDLSLSPDGQTDGTDSLTAAGTGVDRWRRPLLEKTRPFILVGGQRRSLAEALQVRDMTPHISNRSKVNRSDQW